MGTFFEDEKSKLAFGVERDYRRFRLRLARYQAMAEAIASFVRERRKEQDATPVTLLDVGVGKGRTYQYLEKMDVIDDIIFYGVDISAERLEKTYAASKWHLVRGDVETGIPFQRERFDICICEQVLEHLDRPDRTLREMSRVLKPSGLTIVGVPTFLPGVSHLRNMGVTLLEKAFGITREHVQSFTPSGIEQRILDSGPYEIRDRRGFRFVSGGPIAFLENYEWWYRANRKLGSIVPFLCGEIQILARKVSSS